MARDGETSGAEVASVETPGTPKRRFARSDKSFLSEVTATDFPVSRRGYDRAAVNRYVERMTRIVAELEGRRSPEAAIERALADVGEETSAILRRARAAADELVSRAESEKHEVAARAEAQAKEVREEADRYREVARKEADETVAQAKAAAEQERTAAGEKAQATRADADRYRDELKAEADKRAQETRATADRYRDELKAQAERIARERDEMLHQLRDLAENLRRIELKARGGAPSDGAGAETGSLATASTGHSPTSLAPGERPSPGAP